MPVENKSGQMTLPAKPETLVNYNEPHIYTVCFVVFRGVYYSHGRHKKHKPLHHEPVEELK